MPSRTPVCHPLRFPPPSPSPRVSNLLQPSPVEKLYSRASLQGIVNCSCSANLHKSILNQLSGLRKSVCARGAASLSQVGNAARRICTGASNVRRRRDRRRRRPACVYTPRVYDDVYTLGVLKTARRRPREERSCRLTACVRARSLARSSFARVRIPANKVTNPSGTRYISNRGTTRAKKLRARSDNAARRIA